MAIVGVTRGSCAQQMANDTTDRPETTTALISMDLERAICRPSSISVWIEIMVVRLTESVGGFENFDTIDWPLYAASFLL